MYTCQHDDAAPVTDQLASSGAAKDGRQVTLSITFYTRPTKVTPHQQPSAKLYVGKQGTVLARNHPA